MSTFEIVAVQLTPIVDIFPFEGDRELYDDSVEEEEDGEVEVEMLEQQETEESDEEETEVVDEYDGEED